MRALDLFACEGGVTRGLQAAGFDVTAVDSDWNRLKRNPAGTRVCGDAIQFAERHGHAFDLIWASPPCQDYTAGTRAIRAQGGSTGFPRLIAATRDALMGTGRPWAIENVTGAKAELINPMTLCGTMFYLTATDDDGTLLHLQRHRLIESNLPLTPPGPCRHEGVKQWAGVYGGARRDKTEAREVRHGGYVPPSYDVQAQLVGLPGTGMTVKGLQECVPPQYAEHVARQVRDLIAGRAA